MKKLNELNSLAEGVAYQYKNEIRLTVNSNCIHQIADEVIRLSNAGDCWKALDLVSSIKSHLDLVADELDNYEDELADIKAKAYTYMDYIVEMNNKLSDI